MNKNTRIVIIEDEKPAARLLHGMIASLRPEWEINILPGSITGAVKWFAENEHPDIIFLDIHLLDGNSFLFVEQAKPESLIIFTTAYDEYAVQAFTVNSIDYLLKPIQRERLEEAIVKYENLASNYLKEFNETHEVLDVLKSMSNPEKKYRTRFLITSTEKFYKLSIEEIAYFYTEEKITFAVSHTGKEHIIDLTLERLFEQLDPDRFFRANRQIILHIDAITKIEPYFQNRIVVHVKPEFKEKILISREKITAFKMWLNY
ncbi:LytTR family DNA-binding domain-containing protein [Parabacteroides johnsonii]|nr:LytTR family DNA-binding domain-containing protein [Parabacteroides johnsonii]